MKFKKLTSMFCVLICIFAVTTSAFASTYASGQINDYLVSVSSDNGQIYVDFSVTGTGSMKEIGCESIYIYESSSGRLVESLNENNAGMSTKNARRYANVGSADCEVGVRYRVVVTIFAEDSASRDTRSKTTYVTGQA